MTCRVISHVTWLIPHSSHIHCTFISQSLHIHTSSHLAYVPWHMSRHLTCDMTHLTCDMTHPAFISHSLHIHNVESSHTYVSWHFEWSHTWHDSSKWHRLCSSHVTCLWLVYVPSRQKSPTFPVKRALHSLSKEPNNPHPKSPTFPVKRASVFESCDLVCDMVCDMVHDIVCVT